MFRSMFPGISRGVSTRLLGFGASRATTRVAASRLTNRFATRMSGARMATTTAQAKKEKGIKLLMKKYGSSALIVYIGLMLIDLPLCYLAVHSLGDETIAIYLNRAKRLFGYGKDEYELVDEMNRKKHEKEAKVQYSESWWTQVKNSHMLTELILAYGLHKSLIVVRIPLTAAITPYAAKIFKKYGLVSRLNFTRTMADDAKIRYK